ncbi:hypothetical protein ECG_03580 [Echinococcus granulosus]|uniref:Expressed protein n=1 Tax=Echinococcus granulosus TaxID=6210 RepID=A0A068WUF7_ECHGR|nr:hypothetical protein ECG_03580 [Echinococcus granulosus]CDS23460.1 expressed protein [Echinococcus granulosus]
MLTLYFRPAFTVLTQSGFPATFLMSKTQGTQFIPIEQTSLKDFEVEDDEEEDIPPTSKSQECMDGAGTPLLYSLIT